MSGIIPSITPMRTNKKNDWTSRDGLRDLIAHTNLHDFCMAELGSYAGESYEGFVQIFQDTSWAIRISKEGGHDRC